MSIKRKIVRFVKIALKSIGILLVLFIIYFIWDIRMPTPPIDAKYSLAQYKRIEVAPNHYQVGNCWLKKNDYGIWEMYLEGEPYERGLIYGVLAKELMEKQEVHFVNQINEIVPNRFTLFFLKMFVAWFNGDLDEYIPEENLTEIYGVSQSFSDKYNYIGPKYYRILNYHAAHDIGHALTDLSLVGCSSFSVNNNLSADSSLLIARNFDFYMGDEFAEDKLILFVKPSTGYGFASYSWAGLTGVVSGMNEKGLTVTLNASKSAIPTGAKDPISLLAREILQYAATIDEAVSIAKKRETFVSESLLIGSASDKKSIIIEKSPEKMDVFDSKQNSLTCSNHYQSGAFLSDSVNISNINNSDSKYRFDRMNELLDKKYPITPAEAVDILRNKNGLNDEFIGYGNSKSLNQLIAHHAVIFKPYQRLFWISTPPYQLGDFIGYDLKSIFNDKKHPIFTYIDSLTITADPFIQTDAYKKYEVFKKIKQLIHKSILLNTPFTLSKTNEEKFIKTNPKSYITYLVLGEYHQNKKNYQEAIHFFKTSLTYNVASKEEEEEMIKSNIKTCQKELKIE
ncbi:MAG: peptidase C45 [Flavobacteriales bacterium CG_4_9_14_3_um_filter_32_8]|nr:MAG: peptidase C45 [Flavobacteriales bacterium CG_4_9_14_3_um_filter_32_8]